MCALIFKSSHRIADVLASTLACTTVADAPVNYSRYTCSRDLKLPIALMGDSRFARCLQGGGVYVDYGSTVAISSCNISGNNVGMNSFVRAQRP